MRNKITLILLSALLTLFTTGCVDEDSNQLFDLSEGQMSSFGPLDDDDHPHLDDADDDDDGINDDDDDGISDDDDDGISDDDDQ
jgi:hypothetical protein